MFRKGKNQSTARAEDVNEQRAREILQKYGFDFSKIVKEEIRQLLQSELNCPQPGSAEYIRVLCGYLYCVGDQTDVPLLEKAKYGISMDVGCMIDSEWIESLKNHGSIDEDVTVRAREEIIKDFIAYYRRTPWEKNMFTKQ
ncbi:MAG: hypothetical protein IKC48_04445 [Clostridia bacterium]|nr:hypothetical protein [Clostridia bacterium]